MEGMATSVDLDDDAKLPVEIQMYFWQQTGVFLKQKLAPEKYQPACVALERLLCAYRIKDLRLQAPEIAEALDALPRWSLIRGALPYVFQCCSKVLSSRGQLGLSDRLTVAVTKLMYTLHWCLMEAPKECKPSVGKVFIPLHTVELFVQLLIPCVFSVREEDLTFSLQDGVAIWQPLWNHQAPNIPWFCRPVVLLNKCVLDPNQNQSESSNAFTSVARIFDVAVLKCLNLQNWSDDGMVWCLQYILQYLKNLVLKKGIAGCQFLMTDLPQIGLRKHSSFPKRAAVKIITSDDQQTATQPTRKSLSAALSKDDINVEYSRKKASQFLKPQASFDIPREFKDWVSIYGTLSFKSILEAVRKVIEFSMPIQLSDSLLHIISLLLELGIVERGREADENIWEYETMVSCMVGLVKLLGCEYGCAAGVKGQKGQRLRTVAHHYVRRLIKINESLAKVAFEKISVEKDCRYVVEFLHALAGCCEGKMNMFSPVTPEKIPRTGISCASDEPFRTAPFLPFSVSEAKMENEALILEWCLGALLHEFDGDIDHVIDHGGEFLEEFSRIVTYTKLKYENVFRKVALAGLLDSFQGSSLNKRRSQLLLENLNVGKNENESDNRLTVEQPVYEKLSPKSKRKFFQRIQFKTVLGQEGEKAGKSPGKQRKPIPALLKSFPSEVSDDAEKTENSTGFDLSLSPGAVPKVPRKEIKNASESLRQRIFGKASTKRKLDPESITPSEEQKPKEVMQDNVFDKITNVVSLRDGLMQLRVLFHLLPPGKVPEAAAVGSMLDLEAPVLARAAFMLECARFVHACNIGDWPTLMRVGMFRRGKEFVYKGQLTPYQLGQMKQDAGFLFYGWALALARKLEEVCNLDRRAASPTEENKRNGSKDNNYRVPYDDSNLFLEGDISLLTTKCPVSLKYLACQLLLEITIFLREVFQHFASSSSGSVLRERTWTATSRGSSDTARRLSTQVGHVRFVKQNMQKSGTAPPVISVEDENASKGTKIKRKESIYFSHKAMTSPRTSRKLSRHKSKIFMPKPTEYVRADSQRGSPYTSLEVGSEDGGDDDELLEECWNFPWMNSIANFCRSCISPCTHTENCDSSCPQRQAVSCSKLTEALFLIYEPHDFEDEHFEDQDLKDQSFSIVAQVALSLACFHQPIGGVKDIDPTDACSRYLLNRGLGFMHAPFSTFCKSAHVIDKQITIEIMPIAWQLLLMDDQELASTAACVFLIAAAQLESFVTSFVSKELQSSDPNVRAKAVLRIGVLWSSKYHVWKRMEEGSWHSFRIPPVKVDYTLPSPLLGGDPPSAPDPPWSTSATPGDDREESDEDRYLYYVDEEKHLEAKEKRRQEKLKKLRINFQIRTVFVAREATIQLDFQEEDDPIVVQPLNPCEIDFYPPSICAVTPELIRLIDDSAVADDGVAVGQLAQQLIFKCLVEDAELFFNSIFEKITKPDKQGDLLIVLRKLLVHLPAIPPQAGSFLFNNLAGVIMYHHRTSKPGCQSRIAAVLSVLWQVAPNVPDLIFKDMKQSLKKEHAESVFMVTANVPGAKKIAVTYLNNTERLNVQEEMTFGQILKQCKNMFETEDPTLFLVDKLSCQILEENVAIRDVYPHMRGYSPPDLKLEKIDPQKAYSQRQVQSIIQKETDIGKLMLSDAIFRNNANQRQVTFLISEFYKQMSFPRKAIQIEFDLCHSGSLSKELFSLDVLQKVHWSKLICNILQQMSESSPWGEDIQLFLNVINGALLLHSEDMVVLRNCLAFLISIASHFGNLFSVDGYQLILPTLLRVYSHHQDNDLVKGAIEFTVSRFLALHQTPFIIQLFASAAPILQIDALAGASAVNSLDLVPSKLFFAFVDSFDTSPQDVLGIMNLVNTDLPIKPYDSSCKVDPVETNRLDMAIRMAVTVIAYGPESIRATQMLVVLSALVPHFLARLQQETNSTKMRLEPSKVDRQRKLLVSYIGTVIQCCEFLCKSYKPEFSSSAVSEQAFDTDQQEQGTGVLSWNWWSSKFSTLFSWMGANKDDTGFVEDVDRLSVAGDDENPLSIHPLDHVEREALNDYYLPRMVLLYLVSDFISKWSSKTEKVKEQGKSKQGIPQCIYDDHAAILIDISISMLRLALYDQDVLTNVGLQRFMLEGLPCINWSREKASVFGVIVDRFVKIFQRLLSQHELMKFVNWDALEVLLRGIHNTVKKQRNVSKLPEMKALMNSCIQLILGDVCSPLSPHDLPHMGSRFTVSMAFANTVAKLAARLIQVNDTMYSLKTFCAGYSHDADVPRMERFLLYWVLPLCLRLGTGRHDYPNVRQEDIKFGLGIVMSVLCPKPRKRSMTVYGSKDNFDLVWSPLLSGHPFLERIKDKIVEIPAQLCQLGFLGLKIIITAFEDDLSSMWTSISFTIQQLMRTGKEDSALWEFFHFITCSRSPLMLHVIPYIHELIGDKETCSNVVRNHKYRIERDLMSPPQLTCKAERLRQLLDELTTLTRKDQEIQNATATKPLILKPAPRRRRDASILKDEDLQQMHLDSDGASDSSKEVFFEQVGSPETGGSFRRRSKKRVSFSDEKQLQRGLSEDPSTSRREQGVSSIRSYASLDESALAQKRRGLHRQSNVDSPYGSPEHDGSSKLEQEDGPADIRVDLSPEKTKDRVAPSALDRQRGIAIRGKSRWTHRRQEWLKKKDSSILRRRMEQFSDTLEEEEAEYQNEEQTERQDNRDPFPLTNSEQTNTDVSFSDVRLSFATADTKTGGSLRGDHRRLARTDVARRFVASQAVRQRSIDVPTPEDYLEMEQRGRRYYAETTVDENSDLFDSSAMSGSESIGKPSNNSTARNMIEDSGYPTTKEEQGYGVVVFLSSGSVSDASSTVGSEKAESYV